MIVLGQLAHVAHPGDDDDPSIIRARAVWRSRVVKDHAFFMARLRHDVMRTKCDIIRLSFSSCLRQFYKSEASGAARRAEAADARAAARSHSPRPVHLGFSGSGGGG